MTRILYLTEEEIQFASPMVRGGAIHVRNVVTGLRDRGHEVALIDWNDDPDSPFQYSVAPAYRLVDGPVRTLRRVMNVGKWFDPEVVVSKTRKTYLPGLVAARRLGIPHVVHVGSSLEPRSGPDNWLSAKSFALRLRAPHDGYFVVCGAIAEELRSRGVRKGIYNVRNAVDTERFGPEPADGTAVERFRRRSGSPAGDPTVTLGFVGGLYEYKGLFDLAVAIDRCETPVSLLLAGDGPIREELEARLGDRATFLGAVPYEDVPAVYHAADAFVLPSHTEGLPRVVLEAQATATPVIATRVGGVPEVVADGETGLLCPPHAPNVLGDTIDRLASDPGKRARLGENGRTAVAESFSWSALYDRYEDYLGTILDRHARMPTGGR